MHYRAAEPLLTRNTLALQASARFFSCAATESELVQAYHWAQAQGLWLLPLGQGSNTVFADAELEALVLKLSMGGWHRIGEDDQQVTLRVGGGQDWHQLVCNTVAQGWYGLENLALIPGTAGAAPVQNIGAYGVELSDVVVAVRGLNTDTGEFQRLSAQDCSLAYRDSIFKGELRNRFIITAIDLCLRKQPCVNINYPVLADALSSVASPTPQQVLDKVISIRRSRLPDPAEQPNAGSFFKNPIVDKTTAQRLRAEDASMPQFSHGNSQIKLAAAYLIDQCGFKGCDYDGVGVHDQHALVLVNRGSNSGAALLALAHRIQAAVKARYGVALAIEPRIYGVGGEQL